MKEEQSDEQWRDEWKAELMVMVEKHGMEAVHELFRKMAEDCMPEEMGEVFADIRNGKIKVDDDLCKKELSDKVLDSYNKGERTMFEVDAILGDKKFTRAELRKFKKDKKK